MFSGKNISKILANITTFIAATTTCFAAEPSALQAQRNLPNMLTQQTHMMEAMDAHMARDMDAMSAREAQLLSHVQHMTHAANQNIHPGQAAIFQSVTVQSTRNGKTQSCTQQANYRGQGGQFKIVNAQATGNEQGCLTTRGIEGTLSPQKSTNAPIITPVVDIRPAHQKDKN